MWYQACTSRTVAGERRFCGRSCGGVGTNSYGFDTHLWGVGGSEVSTPAVSDCSRRTGDPVLSVEFFSFIDINRKPFWLRVLWSCVDFFNLHALLVSWFVCIREKPDVTLVHGIKGLTLALPVLLNVMKCRWVFTPHDIQFVIPSGQLRKDEEHILSSPYVFVYRILMRRLLGSPPRVVVSSHFLADFYRSYGFFRKSDISVIPSPTPSIPVLHHHTTLSSPVTFLFAVS